LRRIGPFAIVQAVMPVPVDQAHLEFARERTAHAARVGCR
jgi:hypothetical protein